MVYTFACCGAGENPVLVGDVGYPYERRWRCLVNTSPIPWFFFYLILRENGKENLVQMEFCLTSTRVIYHKF